MMPIHSRKVPADKVRVVFEADREMARELRVLAARADRSMAAELRIACREHLERVHERQEGQR